MPRFGSLATQYFDNNGDPLSGGFIYFYQPDTDTAKTVYSDEDETVPLTQPVELDAGGYQPDIFFTGQARSVLTNALGEQVDAADPVGEVAIGISFSTYNSTLVYGSGDIITGPNAKYYKSLVSNNVGNAPPSSPTVWAEIQFLNVYNANTTYSPGDLISYNNLFYSSLVGSNVGRDPETSPGIWQRVGVSLLRDVAIKTASFTAEIGKHYMIDTSGGAFTVTLPADPFRGNMVGFTDYGRSFSTDNLTLNGNGKQIVDENEEMIWDVLGYSGGLEYTNNKGWVLI